MSKRIFIDTQYVVALINQRDQFHRQAIELARKFDGRPFLTTDAVLIEIGNSLSRQFRSEAVGIIDRFSTSDDIEIVRITPDVLASALAIYRSHDDKSWGMTDCISFVVMRQAGIQDVLTHDQHFTQAGFRALLRDG